MQIQFITVKNFKSLVNFRLDLAKFTCLVGLNGAGKSTVLQLVDFIGQQVRGNLEGWLSEREWDAADILSKLVSQPTVDFSVALVANTGETEVTWDASFDVSKLCCTSEHIVTPGATLRVRDGRLRIEDLSHFPSVSKVLIDENNDIPFSYQGSILSQLKEETLPASLVGFKNYFKTVKSLDLLSPDRLRLRARDSAGSLGRGGERLSSFLYELGDAKRADIVNSLRQAYKQLDSIDTRSLRSGWKLLEITESYRGSESGLIPQMTTEARHVNDGMLRLIAILAELETDNRFLLFDEIENGINPELVEMVVNTLVAARQQVLVTTHSPMILNFLEDPIATAGVAYLYKTPRGYTKSIPFFSIPSLAKKLTVMGPGEAFVDTNLTSLADEISEMTGATA